MVWESSGLSGVAVEGFLGVDLTDLLLIALSHLVLGNFRCCWGFFGGRCFCSVPSAWLRSPSCLRWIYTMIFSSPAATLEPTGSSRPSSGYPLPRNNWKSCASCLAFQPLSVFPCTVEVSCGAEISVWSSRSPFDQGRGTTNLFSPGKNSISMDCLAALKLL